MSAIVKITDQLLKSADKAPGWAPLAVVVDVLLYTVHFSEHVSPYINRPIEPLLRLLSIGYLVVPEEVFVTLITWLVYQAGDALDRGIFEPSESTKKQKRNAGRILGVDQGMYGVSLKLATTAEKQRKKRSVWVWNELAKLLRSLSVLLLLIAAVALYQRQIITVLLLVIGSAVSLLLYFPLKNCHIQGLYRLVRTLIRMRKVTPPIGALKKSERYYKVHDLGDIRMYFWDGELVGACERRHHD